MEKHTFKEQYIQRIRDTIAQPESGQIIILMAFLMIALIAIGGLAIDGGELYRAQRDTQNALDAALLSASYALCVGDGAEVAIATGYATAEANGFTETDPDVGFAEDGPRRQMIIQSPPPAGVPHAGDPEYVYGSAWMNAPSHLIRLVYDGLTKVTLDGLVRCDAPDPNFEPNPFPNMSVVGLSESCSGNYGYRGGGSGDVAFCGGGVGTNADANSHGAGDQIKFTGNITVDLPDGTSKTYYDCEEPTFSHICGWNGGVEGGTVETLSEAVPNPLATLEPPAMPDTCNGNLTPSDGEEVIICGIECYTNVTAGKNNVIRGGTVEECAARGITTPDRVLYVTNLFSSKPNSSWEVTGLMTYTQDLDLKGDAVFTPSATGSYWDGFTLWSPVSGNVKLNAQARNTMVGTFYLPNARMDIVGGEEGVWVAQIIADKLLYTGGGGDVFIYDETQVFQFPPDPPVITVID